MDRKLLVEVVVVLPLLLLGGCTQLEVPRTDVRTPLSEKSASEQPLTWEQKWARTLAEAKREGTVNFYVSAMWGSELRLSLARAFENKYGIEVAMSPMVGAEMAPKVKLEQASGLYLADVFGSGTGTFLIDFVPNRLLGPIEPMLILPDVLDPRSWEGGDLFAFDRDDHMVVTMLRVINRSIFYNKDLISEKEIDSYKDLLNPRFKGKITMTDPSITGPGSTFANHLVDVYGFDEAVFLLRELIEKQGAVIQRDGRLHTETVARGKYWIGLGAATQYVADFLALGAPIAVKVPKEGDAGGTSFGVLAVPTRSLHPNAGAIFVNWLLTREGQTLFAKGAGNASRRLDVSTEGINPVFLPLPGEKLAWDTKEFVLRFSKVQAATRDIVSKASR